MALTPSSSSGASSSSGGVVAAGSRSADLATAGASFAAGADVLAAALSFTADGTSSYAVFLFSAGSKNSSITGDNIASVAFDGAQLGVMMFSRPTQAANASGPTTGVQLLSTPAAGVHTVNVRFWVDAGTGTLYAATTLGAAAAILVYILKLA